MGVAIGMETVMVKLDEGGCGEPEWYGYARLTQRSRMMQAMDKY